MQLTPLTEGNVEEFARLLGGDEFGGCFCAVWTHFGDDWVDRCRDPERPNLARTRADLAAGRRPGFLVRRDGALVGWTGAGPKREFPLLSSRLGARRSEHVDGTWCIACLAIERAHRGGGLAEEIVRAVIERARSDGAQRIEAYPTDPWDEPRSYRGARSMFRRVGFHEIDREADGDSAIVLLEMKLR